MLWLCLCKHANICISVLLHVSLRKSIPEIGVKFFVFFTFFINFFYKNINQEHNLLPDCAFGLLMYVAKLLCQASLPLFLTWVSLAIFCLEKCQMEIASSASLSLVGEITHWCMNFVWMMAAIELHVNATYYAQHPALK